MRLHPSQSRVYRAACLDGKRFVVLVAGRRWGKTTLGKAVQLSWIQQSRPQQDGSPARFAYVAPTYKEGRRTLWRAFKTAIPNGWVAKVDESRLEIRFVNGAEWYLLGADKPDSLRGSGWNGLHIDEYATMKPEAWTDVLQPAIGDREGAVLFTGTPQAFNHFHDLYAYGLAGTDPEWASFTFKTRDAVKPWGHFPAAELERAMRTMDPRTFRQEYEASFEALSGRIYYAFTRDGNVRPVTLDKHASVSVSFDFNINPATAVIGQVQGDRTKVWREVFLTHLGGEATVAAARQVKRLLREAGHAGPARIYGDSTGQAGKTTGPSDHAVLRAEFPGADWRIPRAQPVPRDRFAAVNARCATQAGTHHLDVDPSCVHVISDLEQVIYNDKGVEDQKSNPMLTHVAAALGYWIVREWPVVQRKVTVGGMNWGVD
jgi:hypothetical protein